MLGSSLLMASLTTSCTISAISLQVGKRNAKHDANNLGNRRLQSTYFRYWGISTNQVLENSCIQYAADQVPLYGGSSDEGGVSKPGVSALATKKLAAAIASTPRHTEPEVPLMAVASFKHHPLICNPIPQLRCSVLWQHSRDKGLGRLSKKQTNTIPSQLGHINGLAFENSSTKQAHPHRKKWNWEGKVVMIAFKKIVSSGFVNQ